jgi:hypothetical protein
MSICRSLYFTSCAIFPDRAASARRFCPGSPRGVGQNKQFIDMTAYFTAARSSAEKPVQTATPPAEGHKNIHRLRSPSRFPRAAAAIFASAGRATGSPAGSPGRARRPSKPCGRAAAARSRSPMAGIAANARRGSGQPLPHFVGVFSMIHSVMSQALRMPARSMTTSAAASTSGPAGDCMNSSTAAPPSAA